MTSFITKPTIRFRVSFQTQSELRTHTHSKILKNGGVKGQGQLYVIYRPSSPLAMAVFIAACQHRSGWTQCTHIHTHSSPCSYLELFCFCQIPFFAELHTVLDLHHLAQTGHAPTPSALHTYTGAKAFVSAKTHIHTFSSNILRRSISFTPHKS